MCDLAPYALDKLEPRKCKEVLHYIYPIDIPLKEPECSLKAVAHHVG
jgi:hypothetical protein